MKLYAKEKVFSFKGNFEIFNEYEEPVYHLEGELDLLGRRKLHLIQDGRELAFIKEKGAAWTTTVNVFVGDQTTLTIRKKVWAFRPTYLIEGEDWIVKGDFMHYNYEIRDASNRVVARIAKKLISFSDKFEIDIIDPNANIVHIISVVMTIHTDIQKSRAASASVSV